MLSLTGQDTAKSARMIDDVAGLRQTGEKFRKRRFQMIDDNNSPCHHESVVVKRGFIDRNQVTTASGRCGPSFFGRSERQTIHPDTSLIPVTELCSRWQPPQMPNVCNARYAA